MSLTISRDEAINAWVRAQLGESYRVELISGDASFRRYFRVNNQERQYVLMDTPVQLIPVEPFVAIASAYQAASIKVPSIVSLDPKQGFMLLEDLGDVQLLSLLSTANVEKHYQAALAILPKVATVTTCDGHTLPDYDDSFVERELGIFTEWLVSHHLGLALNANDTQMLQKAFQLLAENIEQQPKVGMHRDFHSRNLMCFNHDYYVIDFQDAVLGPITYDSVSLLRDCYVRWPQEVVEGLAKYHYQLCLAHNLLSSSVSFPQYMRWFDLTGLQRHIKAAGIFARLNYRDNKPGYMADIPLTLSYIADISARYPELHDFHHWISEILTPAFNHKASSAGEKGSAL